MSNDIEKLRLEEKIRVLCFKHRGNLDLIAKEGLVPIEYAKKIVDKIKRRQKRDANFFVGSTVAEYIMMGAEQRKEYLIEQLRTEVEKSPIEISLCCGRPIKKHVWNDEEHSVCTKCEKDCGTEVVDPRDKKLIIKLIEQLRQEDVAVVEFLEKLGFVNKSEENPAPKITQYNLNIGNVSESERKTLQEASNLDPRTREALRKELERKMTDVSFEGENSDLREL